MHVLLMLAAAASPQSASAPAPLATSPGGTEQLVSEKMLNAIVDQLRSFKPRDQFDPPPTTPSMKGRRFSYVVKPLSRGPDNLICSGFPSWGYWAADGTLEVGTTTGSISRRLFQSKSAAPLGGNESPYKSDYINSLTYLATGCDKTRLPDSEATNGFGAKFVISNNTEAITAIAEPGRGNFDWKLSWSTKISGNEARALVTHVAVRISGTLDDWMPGQSVVCVTDVRSPTYADRVSEAKSVCLYKGRADLFEVIDDRDGKILFSSPRPD